MVLTSAAMQKAAKRQEQEHDKWAYNLQIKDLKQRFNEEVDSIAQEFSGQGVHRSVHQIRKQVLFSMGQQAKTCKPSTYNAWAHAEVQAERLGGMLKTRTLGRSLGWYFWAGDDFASLPYSDEYISLLKDVKERKITYEDIQGLTPEQEYHQSILLQGVLVKREQRSEKKNIIAPELSLHHMAEHVRNELVELVGAFLALES